MSASALARVVPVRLRREFLCMCSPTIGLRKSRSSSNLLTMSSWYSCWSSEMRRSLMCRASSTSDIISPNSICSASILSGGWEALVRSRNTEAYSLGPALTWIETMPCTCIWSITMSCDCTTSRSDATLDSISSIATSIGSMITSVSPATRTRFLRYGNEMPSASVRMVLRLHCASAEPRALPALVNGVSNTNWLTSWLMSKYAAPELCEPPPPPPLPWSACRYGFTNVTWMYASSGSRVSGSTLFESLIIDTLSTPKRLPKSVCSRSEMADSGVTFGSLYTNSTPLLSPKSLPKKATR
mmetsp:Transcript_31753/g.83180  ORF Transcript_31753/g.83180 Transcript_31753/m.83180 type:complete len:299 (-) Transcript_31753:2269-3165(-)